jgi:hypothetical protein
LPWLISPLVAFAAFAAGIGILMSHRLTALTAQPPGVEIAGTTAIISSAFSTISRGHEG